LLVAAYPFMKRITWWPQAWLGLTFNWGVLLGFAVQMGSVDVADIMLYAGLIFWTLGYDTIYAHQDKEDDELIGVKSTARLFGRRTAPFLIVCYSATILLVALSMAMQKLSWFGVFALVLPAALLARQIVKLDIDNPEICLALFKSNGEAGLAIALAILIGQL
jgi:4-hydroxybenzoate polyprenyltransferase